MAAKLTEAECPMSLLGVPTAITAYDAFWGSIGARI